MTRRLLLIGAVILIFGYLSHAQRLGYNPCARIRCLNGGTCRASGYVAECRCPEGFTGDRCQFITGPISRNPCRNFVCQNGGSCTAPADAPSCICAPGFFGTNCEFNRNPCFNFKCQNGGRCTAPADAPYCECPSGFTGNKCETRITGGGSGQCPKINKDSVGLCRGDTFCSSDSTCSRGQKCCPSACGRNICTSVNVVIIDPCRNFVCQNGGSCTAPADAPSCICAPGFFGTNCEFNRDPCFNFKCQNGGRCTAPADAPYCECPSGFTGTKCETRTTVGGSGQCPKINEDSVGACRGGTFCSSDSTCPRGLKCCPSACGRNICKTVNVVIVDPCRNFVCQNGGSCTAPADAPSCICAPGFFGTNCEFNRNPCFNFKCQNGGRCTAPADAPSCVCPKGFTGKRCETSITGGGSGQCPIIYEDTVGVCGGQMCSRDSECANITGAKCCASACGGRLCTVVNAVEPEDLITLCSLIDCTPDRICRATLPCDTCEPVAACVPLSVVGEGLDLECQRQNYLQVLLVQDASLPDNYSQLKCKGPLATRSCPPGSVCVDDLRGGGTCCLGKLLDDFEKPGTCPINEPGDIGVCGGERFCDKDSQCPGSQKCCGSPCGGSLCTDPDTENQGPVCPDGCPKGYICEYMSPPCEPGRFCPQYVIPTCVLPTDECGGCPVGQTCELLFPLCLPPPSCDSLDPSGCTRPVCEPRPICVPVQTTPAPVDECGGCPCGKKCELLFPPCAPPRPCDSLDPRECIQPNCKPIPTCVDIYPPEPVDPCGGCRKGEVCIDTGIRCVTTPCPTFQCVANNSCGGCPPGQICQKLFPPCPPPKNCDEIFKNDPTAKCTVPECKPIDTCVIDPETDLCGGCPPGSSCQQVFPTCQQTNSCEEILRKDPNAKCTIQDCSPRYTCLKDPVVDPCGGCGKGQVCIDTGIRCVTTPCPTFQCVANNSCGGCPPGQKCQTLYPPCLPPHHCDEILQKDPTAKCTVPECKPINTCVNDTMSTDQCGGCPQGQTCQPMQIFCKKAPCPQFSCVPIQIVDPPPPCDLKCPPNTVCELKAPRCSRDKRCSRDPVPQCSLIQLASCPKFPPTLDRCPVYRERDLCSSDADCNAVLNQRCCPSRCNVRVCTTVPRFPSGN